LSELQTEVAEILGMERGQKNSKAERLNHKQYKQKAQELAKQKDLKAEIAKLRAELKEAGAIRSDYAVLEQVAKDLKEQIKAKNLTIDKLQNTLDKASIKYKERAQHLNKMNEVYKAGSVEELAEEVVSDKNKLIEAQETILDQKVTIDTQKEEISALKSNLSRLQHNFKKVFQKFINFLGTKKVEEILEKEIEEEEKQEKQEEQAPVAKKKKKRNMFPSR